MGKPDEIAAAALFLCSDEASFIAGSAYSVDSGTLTLRSKVSQKTCSYVSHSGVTRTSLRRSLVVEPCLLSL